MPWTPEDYPPAFKNLPEEERLRAIRIANAALEDCLARGGEEKNCAAMAIRVALAAVKKAEEVTEMRMKLAEEVRLQRIVENFEKRVRGVDVPIDLEHDPTTGAAGWIRELKIAPSSADPAKKALWARVEWTPLGQELVGSGQYRYVSAEFGRYQDPETGQTYEDVLYAVTLTNRPFVKGLKPLDLGEEWIEVLREGDYMHDLYGDFSIRAFSAWLGKFLNWARTLGMPRAEEEEIMMEEKTVQATTEPPAEVAKFTVVPFQDLPLADPDRGWDADAAEARVRKWASKDGSGDLDKIDWEKYRKAFLWYDSEKPENVTSYKLPIADVIDGRLYAVPRAIFAAAAALQGARGGVDVPRDEIPRLRNHIARYYEKMGRTPPWEASEEEMREKLTKLCEEFGIAVPEGGDPVEALRAYLQNLRETTTTLSETAQKLGEMKKALAEAEERARKAEAEKSALEKRVFFEEMLRTGRITPAERPHLERLYDRDPEGVRAWLSERKPVVDFSEHGTDSAAPAASLEERRYARMKELMAQGKNAVEAYTIACQEIKE